VAKADTSEIDELAFRLYAERLCKMPAQASGEAVSTWAYRKAEEFLSIREKVKSGGIAATASESKLSEVSAPNLKPTHPHNLVSQRFADKNGGEAKVLSMLREIHNWLLQHPSTTDNPIAYSDRGIDWDVPTTNLARVLLPNYVN
jgi:hypothetical protein